MFKLLKKTFFLVEIVFLRIFFFLYPDPDPYHLKRIRIRPNDTDPTGSGSGSATLVKSLLFCHISEYIVICIVFMNSKFNKTIENKIHRVKVTSDPDPDP